MSQHMKRIAIEMDICAFIFKAKNHTPWFLSTHIACICRTVCRASQNFMCGDIIWMWKSISNRTVCVCNKTHPEIYYTHQCVRFPFTFSSNRFAFCVTLIFDFSLPFASSLSFWTGAHSTKYCLRTINHTLLHFRSIVFSSSSSAFILLLICISNVFAL